MPQNYLQHLTRWTQHLTSCTLAWLTTRGSHILPLVFYPFRPVNTMWNMTKRNLTNNENVSLQRELLKIKSTMVKLSTACVNKITLKMHLLLNLFQNLWIFTLKKKKRSTIGGALPARTRSKVKIICLPALILLPLMSNDLDFKSGLLGGCWKMQGRTDKLNKNLGPL